MPRDHERKDEGKHQFAVFAEDLHAAFRAAPVAAATIASALQAPRVELVDDAALLHDDDAVGEAHDLRQFGGDQHDGEALLRQFADEVVHRRLGADIDALGRLVQDDDLRPGRQPFGDDHLLLVAAGQLAEPLLPVRRLDRKPAAEPARLGLLRRARQEQVAHMRGEDGERHVLADAERQDGALVLPVLRHIGDAGRDGIGRRAQSSSGLPFSVTRAARHAALMPNRPCIASERPAPTRP